MKKALFILIIFGFLARFWHFGYIPLSLYWDEVAIGLDARSLIQTGKDLNNRSWFQPLFISYGDYKAPVYIWLTTLIGRIISVSEVSIRLPSLISFFGSAWLLFQLIKLINPNKKLLPWLVLASYSISPWSFHFSRIGFESHLSLFWLLLSIYLVIRHQVILGALAVIAGIYTYLSLRIIAPIMFLITYWLYSKNKPKQLFISLILIGFSLLILIKSPEYQNSQQYRMSNDNLITAVLPKTTKLKNYLINYSNYFDPQFLFLNGDPNLRHHSGFGGELLLVQLPLLIIGSTGFLTRSKANLLLLSWLLFSPTIAALVNETPHASRAIYLLIPLSILIGLGWEQISARKNLRLIIVLALTFNFLLYLHDYFIHYPGRSAQAWIKPYKDAAVKKYDQPVYINPVLYKPELYFAFYRHDLNLLKPNQQFFYYLPAKCPEGAICLRDF